VSIVGKIEATAAASDLLMSVGSGSRGRLDGMNDWAPADLPRSPPCPAVSRAPEPWERRQMASDLL